MFPINILDDRVIAYKAMSKPTVVSGHLLLLLII